MKARYLLLVIISALFLLAGCKKKGDPVPSIETIPPQFIGSKTVTLGCRATSDVKQTFINCGVYIDNVPNPEVSGSKFTFGSDTGLFMAQVYGFTPNTLYYVKAYALNTTAEVQGETFSFTTPAFVTDNDGVEMETVIIKDQRWMAKNLRSRFFRNGETIPTLSGDLTSVDSPVSTWFAKGIADTAISYGNLYTWYAVTDARNICPTGWHVPTDAEWTTLENNLGGNLVAASSLKEHGNRHWLAPYNIDATNMSCFTALPAGYRSVSGDFALLQSEGHFWTSDQSETTKAWERSLSASSYSVTRVATDKKSGYSVRCIKD